MNRFSLLAVPIPRAAPRLDDTYAYPFWSGKTSFGDLSTDSKATGHNTSPLFWKILSIGAQILTSSACVRPGTLQLSRSIGSLKIEGQQCEDINKTVSTEPVAVSYV